MDPLQLFLEQRPRLFSIAYRMLGSVMDAEDMVHETFLRWQNAAQTDVRSPEAYLTSIITRLCINHLKSARVERAEYVGTWLPEPLVTEAREMPAKQAELADTLSMAFLILLESLTPTERAVFLLRVVFEHSYAEVAQIVGKSETNCRQIVRRARQHITARQSRVEVSKREHEHLLHQFYKAAVEGDLGALLNALDPDITFYADSGGKVTAPRRPIHGAEKVARFLIGVFRKLVPSTLTAVITSVNGQPGLIGYIEDRPVSVLAFDVVEERICAIYLLANPEKLRGLGDKVRPAPLH